MGHPFICFLRGRIETDGGIYLVILAEGHFAGHSIDRTGGGINKILHALMTAALEDVEEAHKVAVEISIGIGNAVTDTSLGSKIDHLVKMFVGKKTVQSFTVGEIHPHKAEVTPCLRRIS